MRCDKCLALVNGKCRFGANEPQYHDLSIEAGGWCKLTIPEIKEKINDAEIGWLRETTKLMKMIMD